MDVGATRLVADANLSAESNTAHGTLEVESLNCYLRQRRFLLGIQKAVLDTRFEADNTVEPTASSVLTFDDMSLLNENSDVLFSLDKKSLRPISGSFGLRRRKGEFGWQWPVQKDAVLTVSGDLDFGGGEPSGLLTITCDGLKVDEEHGAAEALANTIGMTVSGDFTLRGKLGLQRGRFLPRFTVAATDAALSSTRYDVQAEGVTGSVTFTDFSPISTPGHQYLRVRSLRLGKLELQNGLVAFRWEDDPAAVFIERTEWGWLGGRIYKHALRIGPDEETISFRVFAEGLDFGELLGFAFGEGATGQGKLHGMIPVTISRSNLADFDLGKGFLYAATAKGWWHLQGRGSQNVVLKALEQQLGQVSVGREQSSGQKDPLRGLLDFEYSELKLDFVKEEGGLTARITAQGHGRNEKIPVEFEQVVLDIPGFDEALRNIMIVKKAIGQSVRRAAERAEK